MNSVLNGGGHKLAAGFKIDKTKDEIIALVKELLKYE